TARCSTRRPRLDTGQLFGAQPASGCVTGCPSRRLQTRFTATSPAHEAFVLMILMITVEQRRSLIVGDQIDLDRLSVVRVRPSSPGSGSMRGQIAAEYYAWPCRPSPPCDVTTTLPGSGDALLLRPEARAAGINFVPVSANRGLGH